MYYGTNFTAEPFLLAQAQSNAGIQPVQLCHPPNADISDIVIFGNLHIGDKARKEEGQV